MSGGSRDFEKVNAQKRASDARREAFEPTADELVHRRSGRPRTGHLRPTELQMERLAVLAATLGINPGTPANRKAAGDLIQRLSKRLESQ